MMNLDRFSRPLEIEFMHDDLGFTNVDVTEEVLCAECGENEPERGEDICFSCIQEEVAGMSQKQVDEVLVKMNTKKVRCW